MEKLEFRGTKGEWEVTQMLNVTSKENGKMICATQSNMNDHEIEANAKLIASSPNLLEALQNLMKEYKSIADSGDCGWWKAEEQEKYINAQKAIQKAIG